jgi:hypothetical protein
VKKLLIYILLIFFISCSSDSTLKRTVVYNKTTNIYHCTACSLNAQCAGDCEKMSMAEAIKKGGKVCKVCKGTCGR